MILFVCALAVALGAFVTASPGQAARIWGSEKLTRMAPEFRTSFLWWYRVLGILICLAGVLIAVDSIVSSNYHH